MDLKLAINVLKTFGADNADNCVLNDAICKVLEEVLKPDVQQLKAEIATRIQTLDQSSGYGYLESLGTFLQHMRRLSAV